MKNYYFFILFLTLFSYSFFTSSCINSQGSFYSSFNRAEDSNNLNSLIDKVGTDLSIESDNNTSKININSEDLPIELNERVKYWINYFAVKKPETFQRYLERGLRYKTLITSILSDHNVPADMYYLAMIESGFVLNAKSSVGAIGFWQFMPATARGRYKLIVDNYKDERKDPIESTKAASQYLSGLYHVFNSWYLAMAAYNAGESRIMNVILKHKTRNFWELAQKNLLPKETLDYVPKFLAAAIIGHDPEKFGFKLTKVEELPPLQKINVPYKAVTLESIAKASGISYSSLKEFNPALLQKITSPVREESIWLPVKNIKLLSSNLDLLNRVTGKKLAQLQPKRSNYSTNKSNIASNTKEQSNFRFHTVQKSETLASISKKYNVKLSYLKYINNLKNSKIIVGEVLKIPSYTTKPLRSDVKLVKHKVKKGENLNLISKKYNISISSLKKQNKLRSNNIKIGQVLIIDKKG